VENSQTVISKLESSLNAQQATISILEKQLAKNSQADRTSRIETSCKDQKATIRRLKKQIAKYSKDQGATIRRLQNQLDVNAKKLEESQLICGKFNGVLIWEIPNFQMVFQGAKRENSMLIRYMYALEWYKLEVQLYLNGTSDSIGKHVSLFIGTVEGPFDDTLQWPMKAEIIVSVMKREEELNIEAIQTDYNNDSKESFQRPPHEADFWGVEEFIDHKQIHSHVINNKLTIKVIVKPR
jgi:Membrane-bound metallopeptidase